MSPTEAVEAAIRHLGNQELAAAAAGVKQPTVSEWRRGERQVPKERCASIEAATSGAVTCEQLNPDLAWSRIPDPTYRFHPEGRPVIEVVAAAEPAAEVVS